ncbi:MAG: phosphoglucosamine mutase [Oscillospiraceae bacterium]|nr:phosphoglucosamine mutase [Oscillospiraceae bacterium]
MGKLFGTDGIRGVVGETLGCALAYRIGQATAISLTEDKKEKPTVVIGMDTRISSDMLENALTAGLCACGANVVKMGVAPTPAVAYLTVRLKADAGVVISASHNPFEHNGIKIFSNEGFKLNDELEARIEDYILADGDLPVKTHGDIGKVSDGRQQLELYLDHLASTVSGISGLRIAVDCANGASSVTARRLLSRFPIEADYIHDTPNGVNINNGCGSTHLESLSKTVTDGGFDLGIAFDGDADRCLAVDENGDVIDGDRIMCALATQMKKDGTLRGGGFVATVMSNLGLHRYAKENGLTLLCADVGDRNVLEMMQREGMCLGGEQSGHTIFLDHMTTGDGQLTALQLLQYLCRTGKKASELTRAVEQYPQVLVNVSGPHDNAEKAKLLKNDKLQAAIREAEAALGGEGRILVRASGTEALIRVMVEARTQSVAEETAQSIAKTVEILQK